MRVNVLLFSSYAEAFGASSVAIELHDEARVADLITKIRDMAGARSLPDALIAVNQDYAPSHRVLKAGDEIAVIPPVAGG